MRHVLFVDDEPAVLSGLRRMLHPMRAEWRMTFVTSANEALGVLASDPADVIIADMRMPGVDGATLLTEIRRRWPDTVRIILSGYADDQAALRSVAVAHQFLSKPCDPESLSATVRSACQMRDRLADPQLRRLVGGIGALPSSPNSFTSITEALGARDASAESVAPLIAQDPGAAAKLLQLVNSAFFGLAKSVVALEEAAAYLGLSKVRDIVLAQGASELFRYGSPELAWVVQEIARHSVTVAERARELAPADVAGTAFVAGLLHDVGRLALASVAGGSYLPIWRERHTGADLVAVEQARLSATHAEVGGYLLRLWGLPAAIVEPVARHCDPLAPDAEDPVVAAVARAAAGMTTTLCRPPRVSAAATIGDGAVPSAGERASDAGPDLDRR
jgi:HD-like signal output (HDOD) protein